MIVTIKRWGNSAAVRIPSPIMELASLTLDTDVNVQEENGRIVIERVVKKDQLLADLLEKITPDNVHAEVSYGGAIGKEAF